MKRTISLILAFTMLFLLCSCNAKQGETTQTAATQKAFTSIDDVTIEKIMENTIPEKILAKTGGMILSEDYSGTGDEYLDDADVKNLYLNSGDKIHVNQNMDFSDGSYTHFYFTNDPADRVNYIKTQESTETSPLQEEEVDSAISQPFLPLDPETDKITSRKEENGKYIITVESNSVKYVITIDPESGYVTEYVTTYLDSADFKCVTTVTYTTEVNIDTSPKPGAETPQVIDLPTNSENGIAGFSAVDYNGKTVTFDDLKGAKVIVVNYWESWCGPCVKELPELQKIYEKYKDKGVIILGVYGTSDDSEIKAIATDNGVTYPIVRMDPILTKYAQNYYPSTIIVDGNGNIISDEVLNGARTYEQWEEIITSYLN